ncbi:MAG TPA: hypothetical protein DCE78_08470 [Bacteroidetes bacterium]|nr:hypothetical protein [Bacteroidota bacterium]
MKKYFLLVVILCLGAIQSFAQVIEPKNPVTSQAKDLHADHAHQFGYCTTIQLLDTPEGIQAQEEFKRWNEAGRPGWQQIMDQEIAQSIGDRKNFYARNFETESYDFLEFELRAIGVKTFIWVERTEYAPNKVSDDKITEMLRFLEVETPSNSYNPDEGIIINNRSIFGFAPNVDGTGMLTVLLTHIPENDEGLTTAGYFAPVNLSLTNSNSNKADIIYINTSTIYNPDRQISIQSALRTLAHEDQHLIHANYASLQTFLNEGQSEWAESMNGFIPRAPSNLQTPEEVNRQLFTWRPGVAAVLFDYARAGLFHGYIAERVGPEATGSITNSRANGKNAYNHALQGSGITFEELLLDFHTANLINNPNVANGDYAYNSPARRSLRTTGISQEYASYMVDVSNTGSVTYGGADVVQWTGVEDFNISVTSPDQIKHRVVGKVLNSSAYDIYELSSGSVTLSGEYESVTLLSMKNGITGATELNEGASNYEYSANWNPLPVEKETIGYYQNSAFYAELPGEPTDPARSGIRRYATRFNSTITGLLNQITFAVSGNARAVQGSGDLMVSLHTSVQNGVENDNGLPRLVPGIMLKQTTTDIRNLSPGANVILLDGQQWNVQKGQEYWVVFEVVSESPDARLEFLIDAGSSDTNDPDYYPTRGRIYLQTSPATGTWARWSSSNNYLIDVQVTGLYEGALEIPLFTSLPDQTYETMFGSSLEVNVAATGTPAPYYIWTKNGVLFQSGTNPRLFIEEVGEDDAGTYTVRAANYAGYTDPIEFIVEVVEPEFRLAQNYPNPFNNSTTFEFSVAEDGFVNIDVFDMMGRLVTSLTPDNLYRRGFHQVSLDARHLASGV